jgi:hypothetical protein
MIFKVVNSRFPGKVLIYVAPESLETVGEETGQLESFCPRSFWRKALKG